MVGGVYWKSVSELRDVMRRVEGAWRLLGWVGYRAGAMGGGVDHGGRGSRGGRLAMAGDMTG